MKLQDLATPQQSKQTAQVFESYFGHSVDFGRLNRAQARGMLHKVRTLIHEHRRQPNFHRSEQNPAYLKLVVMEQGLTARMRETDVKMAEAAPAALQRAGGAAGKVLGAGIGAALLGLPTAIIGGVALGPGGAIGGGAAAGLAGAKLGVDAGGDIGKQATNLTYDTIVNMWRRASSAFGGPEATAEFVQAHARAADMGADKFKFGDKSYAVTMDRSQARQAMNDLAKLQRGMSESQPTGALPAQGQPASGAQDPNATAAGVRRIASATGQSSQAGVLGKAIDAAVAGQTLNPTQRNALATQMGGIQKALADPAMAQRLQQTLKTATAAESRKIRGRRLREASEVQQAQVVLAAQDMVDKMQKMLEEVTAMQFKDLPALVDSIKNEVGQQQANQFNADATAALTGLVQNLQTGKQQMDTALGVVTGQPAAPVTDMGTMPAAADAMGADADLGAAADELGDMAADLDSDDQTTQGTTADLGRGRR